MIRINLAPPVERRITGRLAPVGLAGAFVAVLGGLGWCYALLARAEAHLTEHVGALTRELATLEALRSGGESARANLRDLGLRAQAIHELTRGQDTAVRALDALLDAVPPDLWLTALEGRGPELRAAGLGASARTVAAFTQNLRVAGAFKDVDITVSRQDLAKTPSPPVSFEVTCRFVP